MKASSTAIHPQYLLLPVSAFSNMVPPQIQNHFFLLYIQEVIFLQSLIASVPLNYVKYRRQGTQSGFPLNGEVLFQYFAYLRMRIIQIAKDHCAAGAAGLNTGWLQPFYEPLHAEIAFFNHPAHTCREFFVVCCLVNKRPWVTPIKTSHAVRAGCHAETAAYAAVIIHGHYAILALEGCFGRTCPDTWRVVTMVAEHQKS